MERVGGPFRIVDSIMTLFRVLVILTLVAAILGGSAYYSYELFWKPNLPPAPGEVESPPPPPPDPSAVAYDKIRAKLDPGDRKAQRVALAGYLAQFPDAPQAVEAAKELGALNARRVFSPRESVDELPYKVQKGDSLVRIASKFKTNAELIYRVNNLETINLRIGQELHIPTVDMSMVLNPKKRTITLFDHGEFFKRYSIVSEKAGRSAGPGTTKVSDKLALQGADRVAFGSKNYVGSDRWIMLARPGLVIRGLPEDAGETPPAGILVSPTDIEEIFLLVSRGVPVTIE